MQLLKLDTSTGIAVKGAFKPKRFRDVAVNKSAGKERDIEDLVVSYPGLLNFGEFSFGDQASADLLIISRQATTARRKRADLFAVDREGYFVVIEVKRDAVDEKNRVEGVEFQSIRYAAASRKMTIDAVINMFARYLQAKDPKQQLPDNQWRQQAIKELCEHLADEDEDLSEEDLAEIINPREKQKIYLVAADYEEDVVSACAWLREHKIDISCFRLRPYQIGAELVLERERLIPPPELDDFMTDFFSSIAETQSKTSARLQPPRPSNKPTKMIWSDDEGNPLNVTSWKALVEQVVKKALSEGLAIQDLPMPHCTEKEFATGNDFLSPVHFPYHGIYLDLHGSSAQIQTWITIILSELKGKGKSLELRIDTRNGDKLEF